MVKKSLLFSLLLMIISGGIIFLQWNGYKGSSKVLDDNELEQEIQIVYSEKGFAIQQTFHHLQIDKPQTLIFPIDAKEMRCETKEGECSLNGLSALITPKDHTFTVSYTLHSPPAKSSMLLTNWFVKVKEAEIEKTSIYLTDKKLRTGNWYSGLKDTGGQKKNLINYYEFQGNGGADALYWQSSPLVKVKAGVNVALYMPSEIKAPMDSLKNLAIPKRKTIIVTNQHPAYSSDHFHILNNSKQLAELINTIQLNDMKNKYRFKESEEWLAEVMISLELNHAFGSQKSQKMYQSLQQQLTPEEQAAYKAEILQMKDEAMTAEQLDRMLSRVKGLETHFFQENHKAKDVTKSLVFKDTRSVIVNGKVMTFKAINQKGALLFPFQPTLRQLGFDVKVLSNGRSLLVNKGADTYRFDLDHHRFIVNEEDYGLYENALVTYNGELYIEDSWLQKIFLVAVSEQNDQILIDLLDL
ncbi:stalk domain-containing protein [Bacillus sp. Hm123]|uniref:stalk domain-containing protein n=1 Tax=Bacillus sp. Hm123 TaxID=3450745 RepID=UPI003F42DDD1